jgi:hypothetical protein
MKRAPLLIFVFLLLSCQALPIIESPLFLKNEKSFICPSPFLKQRSHFVHAIETRKGGRTQSAIIGVTVADPVSRSISCAIITSEGMVLFEAESGPDKFRVSRALPPFDSEGFAENMIADIKLIFFMPEGKLQNKGYLHGGSTVCRYQEENQDWIDIIKNTSADIEIRRYSSSGTLKRQVFFKNTAKNIYQHIELQAYETFDYSLLMTLIDAQPIKTRLLRRK